MIQIQAQFSFEWIQNVEELMMMMMMMMMMMELRMNTEQIFLLENDLPVYSICIEEKKFY